MDRLTGWNCGKVFYRHGKESGIQTYADSPPHDCVEVVERLAAYEDTNCMPDDVRLFCETHDPQGSFMHIIEEQRQEIASLRAELARVREMAEKAATDLKYYLENIESKGVVFIPTFVVEKIIIGFERRGKEDEST